MNYPTLYKKTNTGALQYWKIFVKETTAERPIGTMYGVGLIVTEFGQLNTDKPQTTEDLILFGKNIGKKNETTPLQQAEAEALAKWEKQKKKGYVESIEAAKAGETDKLIEGGIVPMLAHKFTEQGHKIKYPCYVQPKLDGIRCIAILKDGKCTLWSRTRKQITSMPHIVAEIESHWKADIVLDGELYNHDFKKDFEKIVSAVRKEEPEEGYLNVQYHVYDIVNEMSFKERSSRLFKCFTIGDPKLQYVKWVVTDWANEDQVPYYFELFKERGYEGAMLRNADSLYVNKRSYDLQKVKEMEENEFAITGVEEGRGKLQGHVGAFKCVTEDGKEFLAKMSGDTANLKKYFEDHSTWLGKQLTVQFQGLTGASGVPRFPVGKAIRDYE